MGKDKRHKGCPNEVCQMCVKKVKQSAEDEYCPKCGTRLVFVCAKCFKEIEDIDSKHKVCAYCEAQAMEKKQQVLVQAKKVAGKAGQVAVAPVVVGVGKKLNKDFQKVAIDKGVKVVKNVAEVAVKALKK